MFGKVTARSVPAHLDYYDAPENAHRRIRMFGHDGKEGILGRDFTATYVILQVDDGKVVSNSQADVDELEEILTKYKTKWHTPCEEYLGGEERRDGTGAIKLIATKQIEKFKQVYADHLPGRRELTPARVTEGHSAKPQMAAADDAERA